MQKTKTTPWDPANSLETAEDIAAHLKVAFEEGDPELIAELLSDIARSKGSTELTNEPVSAGNA